MKTDPIQTSSSTPSSRGDGPTGGNRAVIQAACAALDGADGPTLAIVLETAGSTYAGSGAMALFVGASQTGWLSGGCLEPEIARRAALAASSGTIEWMEVDTQDDDALFVGSAVGCRGRLRLALLPLRTMQGWIDLASSWLARQGAMEISLSRDGRVRCRVKQEAGSWHLPVGVPAWDTQPEGTVDWRVRIEAPPSILVFGAGPETPVLLPLLRTMGWMTTLVERRERWLGLPHIADTLQMKSSTQVLSDDQAEPPFAALVMHHNFELDLETLLALAEKPPPFIGLLGPRRRRDDLFKLLPVPAREVLAPLLHAPVGMDLGGRGPEAIALSIAAQLQSRLHGR